MFSSGFGNNGDFDAMARQYWSAWGEAMRQAGGGAPPAPVNQWQQAVDWWSQLMPGGNSQANDAVGRFNQQASQWLGQMQQVAAQFAGQDNSAADISQAWRRAMGAAGENPFPEVFKAMRGQGGHGLDHWLEQVKPYLDGFQLQVQRWQQVPAFGQYREHQERWQALQKAQQEYQLRSEAFNTLMADCGKRAFEVFEDKLAAREEPGRQITTARGLFDLWIDSAEEAYAGVALSPEFREVYGALGNAQMRLRAAIQREVEHLTALFGMPTRTEVDSAHRKIAELERTLRRAAGTRTILERRAPAEETVAERRAPKGQTSAPQARSASAPRRASSKQAPRRPDTRKAPSGKTIAPKRQVVARKAAAKPAVIQQKSARNDVAAPRVSRAAVTPTGNSARGIVTKGMATKAAATPPRTTAASQKTPGRAPERVVSMKDWVARNVPTDSPGTAARKPPGGKGATK